MIWTALFAIVSIGCTSCASVPSAAMNFTLPKVILLSARPIRFKALSEEWLAKNNIHYDQLILSSYPHLSDPEYKLKMYKELIEPFYEVIFAVDDRDTVVAMWRENGITCFDIAANHIS